MSEAARIAHIALIGFGEVGQVVGADLAARGASAIRVWDIAFADPHSGPSQAVRASVDGAAANNIAMANNVGAMANTIGAAVSAEAAARGADLVISAVTAAEDLAAARSVTAMLARGAWFLDLNSVSPQARRSVARCIDDAGGRYVEAAVMAPISPRRSATPMLLSGPHAEAFAPLAYELGFESATFFSHELGRASAAKMCRSVVVKGMEALLTESMLAARRYGVEAEVLDSLRDVFAGRDVSATARYMISRSLVHGRRRAEEMREVANTVRDAGIDPWMSLSSASRHEWAANHRHAADAVTLEDMLDRMLARMSEPAGVAP